MVRSNEKDLLLGQVHGSFIHLKTVIQSLPRLNVLPWGSCLFVNSYSLFVCLFSFFHRHRCLSLGGIIKTSNTHKSLYLHEKYVVDLFLLKETEWWKSTQAILFSTWGETLTMMHDLTVSSSLKSIVLNRLRFHTIQLYSQYCWAGFLLRNIWRYENLVWPIYFDLGKQLYLVANVCRVQGPYITLLPA